MRSWVDENCSNPERGTISLPILLCTAKLTIFQDAEILIRSEQLDNIIDDLIATGRWEGELLLLWKDRAPLLTRISLAFDASLKAQIMSCV